MESFLQGSRVRLAERVSGGSFTLMARPLSKRFRIAERSRRPSARPTNEHSLWLTKKDSIDRSARAEGRGNAQRWNRARGASMLSGVERAPGTTLVFCFCGFA